MKRQKTDSKYIDKTMSTLTSLLPKIREFNLNQPIHSFLKNEKASTRLKKIISLMPGIYFDTTISEFISLCPKRAFVKQPNCGKNTIRELNSLFVRNMIDWN